MEVDGIKLRDLREERSLSLRELAEMADITHHTIYRIEHGQTNAHPRTIRKLAEALGVEPKELRGRRS